MNRLASLRPDSASDRERKRGPSIRDGFTIVEVMLAASVLVFVIASSLTVIQYGMRAVDTARNMTLAGQICQSALEVLRLQNWSQISALPAESTVNITDVISSGTTTPLDSALNTVAARFTCTRTITDPKINMRAITIHVNWRGNDGRLHSLSAKARYAKNGLNDYIYTSH